VRHATFEMTEVVCGHVNGGSKTQSSPIPDGRRYDGIAHRSYSFENRTDVFADSPTPQTDASVSRKW
jgi:hypothetical protein